MARVKAEVPWGQLHALVERLIASELFDEGIVGDALSENDEKFSLVLSHAEGAVLGTASADGDATRYGCGL